MKRLTLIALSALMAACATPDEIRKRPKALSLSLTSDKTSKQVAICISDKWESTSSFGSGGPLPINTSMKNDGYTIIATARNLLQTWPELIVDVRDSSIGPGSTTKYYKGGLPGYGPFDEVVKQCQ